MDIATHNKTIFRKLIALLTIFVFFISNSQAQNLITNGDFESSGGFTSNYNLTSGPNSNPNEYAVVSNPNTINSNFSNTCVDHTTGSGKMMVVDGSNSNGNKIWEQSPGGGIPVSSGTVYTFSYWIQSISLTNAVGNLADIQVKINGVTLTPTFGSTVCPSTLCTWTQVKYTWTATSNYAQIWLFDMQTSSAGNDFALDDLSLTAPPLPLTVSYSIHNPTCYNNADGFIIAYGSGGTSPYTYSFDGGAFSASNTLTGLATSSHTVSVKDVLLNTVTSSSINITAPANPLTATASINPICSGNNTTLTATNGGASYNWTASPVDASLTTPGIYNPVVSPAVATTYTVTSSTTSNVNLIYNGNFSLGNTGFTTDYTYKTVNTGGAQRCYGVMPNAQVFFNTFSTCGDHTTGTQNMYVVDGSLNSADKVWCQTVVVKPSTTFVFSYWIQTLTINNPAQIETKINGVTVPAGTSSNPVNAPATVACGNWQQVSYSWTSGVGVTTAEICLYDKNVNGNGNDFALDDISFTGSYGCNLSKTISIAVNPPASTNNINLFDCNSVTYHGNTYTSSTIVRDTLKALQGCDSVYNVANITVGMRTVYAYVPNSGDNTVSVINTNNNTIVKTISVGQSPDGVSVSADGKRVYISNFISQTVSVINTATNTVIYNVLVGSSPEGIVISPDGKWLYITNYSNNTLTIVNTVNYTVLPNIFVGSNPGGVVVSPDGTKIYVANNSGGSISVVDAVTKSILATIYGFSSPYGISISPDGQKLYVANQNGNAVSVVSTITNSIIATIPIATQLFGISTSPDGTKVYVSNQSSNTVTAINTATNTVIATITVGTAPRGLSFTPDGLKLYVANVADSSVSVINTVIDTVIITIKVGINPLAFGNFIANVPRSATNNTTNLSSCKSIIYKANTYTTSTVLKDTLHSVMGCDSIYNTVNISINPITTTTNNTSVSGCDSVIYKTIIYKASVVLRDTIRSFEGCDSVYNVATITVKKTTSSTTTINTTNPYTWNGTTYTTSGTYIKTGLVNSVGCDSTATLVLTIASITTNPCWKMISASYLYTLAIKKDGTLWGWGRNTSGQLGDGTFQDQIIPIQIGTDTNWSSLGTGDTHILAIKTDGTLWAWGLNGYSELGNGTTASTGIPIKIGTDNDWASVTAGTTHSLAIKTDGTLWGWGQNQYGQLGDGTTIDKSIPTQIGIDNNWAKINSALSQTLAIKTDGTLWAWGQSFSGQLGNGTYFPTIIPTQAGSANNWADVSVGDAHTCAVKTDGTLWTCGDNSNGQLGDGTNINKNIFTQIGSANNWAIVATGSKHSLAIKTDGSLWAWGWNLFGQLGNGTNINKNIPTQISTANNWTLVSNGKDYTVAVKNDGSLWSWGHNHYGQLGDGASTDKNIPTLILNGCPLCPVATIMPLSFDSCKQVTYLGKIYTLSAFIKDTVKSIVGCDSIYHNVTITVKKTTSSTTTINTTTPYTWNGTTYTTSGTYIKTGLVNSVGCDSTATLVLTIASITTNPCWKMITTGANHTVAIKKDGTLWAWGQNTYGQVGDGTNTHRNIPTQIGTDTNWESVSAKGFHTVAIKTNGTLWAWGQNSFGQVGDGTNINRNVPVQVGTATNWSSISSGISFTLALKKDSTLWAWGYNILGQLGDGTLINKNTPIQIGTYNKWVNIGTGEFHSAAIKVDGTLWTWGSNSNGQLGDGTSVSKNTPTQIGTDNNWVSFKGGNAHTIALKTDNTLWTWGGNLNGQLGDGTNISKNIPTQLGVANNWRAINAGGGFSMALTTTGTIWACGKNVNGQLGNGTTVNNNTLNKIGVDINWVSINAGDNHFIASKTDGSLWACGYNLYGQLGDGTNADKNLPKLVVSGCSPCPVATTSTQTFASCKAIIYKGNTYSVTSVLKDTIKNLQGCDSIYNIVNINISPITAITNTDTASGCGSVVYKSITYTASTVLKDTTRTLQGCDSIYNIATITVHPAITTPTASVTTQPNCTSPTGTIDITAPTGVNFSYSVDGVNYQSSANFVGLAPATYFVTAKDTNTNCISSSLKLVVDTVHNIPTPIGYVSMQPTCSNALGTFIISSPKGNNYGYYINGSALAYVDTIYPNFTSGSYSIVATDLNTGCTSDTLNLVLNPYIPVTPTNNIINLVGCNSIIYKGITYAANAVLKDTMKSFQGCDSIYNVVNISIIPITIKNDTINLFDCDSVYYNGVWYNYPTTLLDTLKNIQGCDSLYKLINVEVGRMAEFAYLDNGLYSVSMSVIDIFNTKISTTISFPGNTPNTLGSISQLVFNKAGTLAFGSDKSGLNVVVIDILKNIVIKKIGVGMAPYSLAISQDDSMLIVSNSIDKFCVIDANKYLVKYTINLQSYLGSGYFRIHPNKKTLYFASTNLYRLYRIDIDNKKIIDSIVIGSGPLGIEMTKDGSKLLIAYSKGYDVAIYNTQTNSITTTIKTGRNPTYLALSKDEKTCYAYNSYYKEICTIDLLSNTLTSKFTIPSAINGLNLSYDNKKLYAPLSDSVMLSVIDIASKKSISNIPINSSYLSQYYFMGEKFVTVRKLLLHDTLNFFSCSAITYKTKTYTSSTSFTDTVKSYRGCDSIYNVVNISINPITTTTNNQTISSCKSVVYNGNTYAASTVLRDTVKSWQGCDSVYNVTIININAIATTTNTQTISSCKSVVYNGNTYAASTVLRDTVKSLQGCDSIYNITNININAIATTTNNQTISSCKSVVYNGNTYFASNVLRDTLKSLQGCDSIYNITNININAIIAITKTSNFTGCGSVKYNNVLYTTSISYFDTTRSLKGCDSIFNTTNIIVYPLPTITVAGDLHIIPNSSVVLNPIITNAASVGFTPASYLDDATSEHPICTPQSDIIYLIKATSIDGCTDTSSLKIFIVKPIDVPNVFSPNGDGINDTWDIAHITDYPFATISIFNRQGQLLKSSKTKSIKVWDGTYNGQPVPVAAYYWIIKLTPNSEPMSGIVTVLR